MSQNTITVMVTITLEKEKVELVEVEFDSSLDIDDLPPTEQYLLKANSLGLAAVTVLQHGENSQQFNHGTLGVLYRKVKVKMDEYFVGQSRNIKDQ